MTKKSDKPEQDDEADITSREAVLAAEREAEERYQREQAEKEAEAPYKLEPRQPEAKTEDAGEPEVPARFTTGGATYDEKQAWYKANRPELADPDPVPASEAVREPQTEDEKARAKLQAALDESNRKRRDKLPEER